MKNIKAKLPVENLVAALLTAWEGEGHNIGTDKYLQINTLLNKLPEDISSAQLKTFLTPLLTQNAQQQYDFYRLFEHILKTSIERDIEHHEAVLSEQKKLVFQKAKYKTIGFFEQLGLKTSNRYGKIALIFIGLAFLGLIIGGVFYFKKQYDDVKASAKVGEVGALCIKIKDGDEVVSIEPKNRSVRFAVNEDWSHDFCIKFMPMRVGADTILCYIKLKNGRKETLNIKITGFPNFTLASKPKEDILEKNIVPKQSKTSNIDTLKPFTYQSFTGDTAINEKLNGQYIEGITSDWEFGLGNAYFSLQKALMVLATLVFVLLLGWYWRYKNQKFTLAYDSDPTDFYHATLRIPTYKNIIFEDKFYRAVSEMRKRDDEESRLINIKQTIGATIKNMGLVDFKYQQYAKAKHYLFLIEQSDPLSIQTKYYDLVVQGLKENEVPIQRFFFDKNTLNCSNEAFKQGISLQDLQHKYADYQLILISSGSFLIENNTLKDWVKIFEGWRKKAIMTPKVSSKWHEEEAILAQKFRLLPASMLGFTALTEAIEAVEPMDYKRWMTSNEVKTTAPNSVAPNNLIANLEAQLVVYKNGEKDDRMMRWLAACALPPVLFWDWTLYVGDMLNDGTDNFFNTQNLASFCQLEWFEKGKITDDMRGVLLFWLEKTHPFWYIEIIHKWSWVLTLEENTPPLNSTLWHGHRIQVILSHLLEHPKAQERRKWELELDKLLRGDVINDAVVVKYLQTRRTPMDSILSDRFRKFIQTKNAFIWRWRDWTWQAPSVFGAFLCTLFFNYSEPITTFNLGENITALSFSPDGEYFMVACGRGKIGMCAVKSGSMKKVETPDNIVMLDATQKEKIYAVNTEGDVLVFDEESVKPLKVEKQGLITAAALSSNYNKLGVSYYNNVAKIFDLKTSKILFTLNHDDAITDIAFSKNEKFIVTTSRDKTVKIWSNDGRLLQTLNAHKDVVLCVDISDDGSKILTGSRDNTAKLWDVQTGTLLHTFEGHTYDILDVHFSPNGQKIVTASGDRTTKLWSIDGKLLRTLKEHRDFINAATFSPDGGYVVTGDSNGKVILWKIKR
jgi:hypothetical protein